MEELDDVVGECESDTVPVPKMMKEKVMTLKQRLTGTSQALGRGKIPKEAREYKMNNRRRGRAVVFNQINFSADGFCLPYFPVSSPCGEIVNFHYYPMNSSIGELTMW